MKTREIKKTIIKGVFGLLGCFVTGIIGLKNWDAVKNGLYKAASWLQQIS